MDEFLKVAGVVCRYVMAALACWWFFLFLTLMGQDSGRSQELAGMAFGKSIICGAAAAIWFYRRRKTIQVQKLDDSCVKDRLLVPPIQSNAPPPPTSTQEAQIIPPPVLPTESHSLEIEEPPQGKETITAGVWIVSGAVFVIFSGIIIGLAFSSNNSGTESVGLSATRGPNPTSVATPSNSTAPPPSPSIPCPTALPAGVSSRALNAVDLSKVVGTDGNLTSEQSYDSLSAPNGTAWNAHFTYEDRTNICITVATVELELSHAGSPSKERHSIVFQPILGVGEKQTVSVVLRIRTPERSEDVALLGWRTVSGFGFASGADVPTD